MPRRTFNQFNFIGVVLGGSGTTWCWWGTITSGELEMIDINELRRLAQAATPGPWVHQGRYIGTPRHMSYIGEVRDQCGNWSDTEKSRSDAAYIAAANPAAISELLDRLEVAESVLKDFGTTAQEVECWLERYRCLEREAEALRARIEEMERQEPVAWIVAPSSRPFWGEYARLDAESEAQRCGGTAKAEPLYALPGAKGEEKWVVL